MMIRIYFFYLALFLFCLFPVKGNGNAIGVDHNKDDKRRKEIKIFESDRLLLVTLKLDLKAYLRKDFKDNMDASLVIHTSATDSTEMDVKVSNRGTYRSSNCNYPPLEISFSKALQAYSGFGKIKRMKLYTCCETGDVYNDYILREFLVYKFYNVLTDSSYRVRLLKVNLTDSHGKRKTLTQYGFFLEPKEILAERIESRLMENVKPVQKQIFSESLDMLSIFNYMVSNYDWSVESQHNVTLLLPSKNNTGGSYIVVPHDFDGTGVVNALYSTPGSGTGMKSIRERTFLGYCMTKGEYQVDLKKINGKKKEIYTLLTEFQYINQSSRRDIKSFLDQFFNQVATQQGMDTLVKNFMENCH